MRARSAGSTSTRASDRAATARRSSRAGTIAADIARAKAWWGDDVTSFHDGSSTSAPLTGVNYNAAYDECPQAAYAGIALEYGTLPLMAVLQALRGDQWLANHPDAPAASRGARSSAQIRDALLPGCGRLEAHGLRAGAWRTRSAR